MLTLDDGDSATHHGPERRDWADPAATPARGAPQVLQAPAARARTQPATSLSLS